MASLELERLSIVKNMIVNESHKNFLAMHRYVPL